MIPCPTYVRSRRPRAALRALPALVLLALFTLPALPADAQERSNTNVANWELFDRFSPDNVNRFIHSSSVAPNWIHETDSLWYAWTDREGRRYMLVDPRGPRAAPLFDHELMAQRLSEELETFIEWNDITLRGIEFAEDGRSFEFTVNDIEFEYDLTTGELRNLGEPEEEEEEDEERPWRNFSPDSTAFVYAEDHNLYFVEVVDGVEQEAIQLTTDGEEDYSFGSREADEDDEDFVESDLRVRSSANWSEDSRSFYITRTDRRHVAKLYLVNVLAEPRPELEEYRYAMPGEDDVPQTELFAFQRDRGELVRLDVDRYRDQHLLYLHWTNGAGDNLRLVRRVRSRRALELIEVDVAANTVEVLVRESFDNGKALSQPVRYLGEDNSGDFIWYSRRTGWAHYYRYDHDGNLLNPVTAGRWNVTSIREIDEDTGRIWLNGVGREAGENLTYQHLYRVDADGSNFMILDPGNAHHTSSISPNRRFILNNSSRVDEAPRSVLRNQNGEIVLELEAMDLSELEEFGWMMPETFVVKAADGVTDIFGNMWKPFDFDPDRSYPIIAYVYPGPQQEGVTNTFRAMPTEQELAQLGFIVVQLGNRGGTPLRSATYHSYGYFNLRDYGLADKKAGIQELAKRHAWIDVERVGMYGHSGGGFMTAAALLVPPYNEFFKVGVSSAGNHDNNVYNQSWSERHHGLEVRCVPPSEGDVAASDGNEGGTSARTGNARGGSDAPARRRARVVANETHCDPDEEVQFDIHIPANHEMAENLQGRLLLQHGDMDNNVHHAGTMRLVRELMRQNKRFDFMMMPGMRHGFGGQYNDYWRLVRAEYFARYLLGDDYRSADLLERR